MKRTGFGLAIVGHASNPITSRQRHAVAATISARIARDGSCAPKWRNSTARNGAYSAVRAHDLVQPVRRVGRTPGPDGASKARDGHDEPEPEQQQPEDGRAHECDGMDRHGTPGGSGHAPHIRRSYPPPARAAIAETRSVAVRRLSFTNGFRPELERCRSARNPCIVRRPGHAGLPGVAPATRTSPRATRKRLSRSGAHHRGAAPVAPRHRHARCVDASR